MKVAIFTDTYAPQMNGVVAYLQDSIRILAKKHEVVLFAPGEGHFRTETLPGGVKVHWIPSMPFPFYEGYRIAAMDYKRVSGLLAREKPDIVHAHAPVNLGLQGLVAAKRKRIPVVITYHTHFPDYVPHLLNGRLPGVLSRLSQMTVKSMIKHAFRKADAVTAPTMELAKELRSYGLDNVVYLPNGIDLRSLKCSPQEAAAFRKAHGIGQRKLVAVYLGRISFEKRIEKLLEAFKLLERDDAVLVIAGGGPYLRNFRQFAAALGLKNIVFTGFVKNKAAAYAASDIFVSASDSETFGLTFVEAMHMGLPAVGVSRLGAKEIIRHGKNGLLVAPGDARAFMRAIERLFSDSALRKRLGRQARKTSTKYSIESSVGKTVKIYERLARSGE
ncbi:MAG: glycosyltransferase [Candidatus Micrarchaeota archaeon]